MLVNWVSIDSGNGFSPVQRPAITWNITHVLLIEALSKNLVEFE